MKKHEKKYIDSEVFFKVINTLPYKDTSYPDASAYNGAISDVADMLTHFPAADVVEVRHGRWRKERVSSTGSGSYGVYQCSICGAMFPDIGYGYNYCPNCGSRMDLDGDTE